MKYRMLTAEERELFDQDFKYFLISHGVKNEEWLQMNEVAPKKAEELVALFSDAVLDIVYKKVKFIEFRGKDSCMVFHCKDDKMEMICLNAQDSRVDLSTPESIHHAILKHSEFLTIFKADKVYSTEREQEIHQMLSQGCFNSSEEFWKALEHLIPAKS